MLKKTRHLCRAADIRQAELQRVIRNVERLATAVADLQSELFRKGFAIPLDIKETADCASKKGMLEIILTE